MNAPSGINEYAELRDFALALAEFVDEKYPAIGGLSYAPSLAEGLSSNEKHLSASRRVQGARMAVGDLLEMTKDLADEMLREVDSRLASRGLPSLSLMRERIWRRVAKILAAGRIRDDAEYYLLLERLNDVGPAGLAGQEREAAARIVAAYEARRGV